MFIAYQYYFQVLSENNDREELEEKHQDLILDYLHKRNQFKKFAHSESKFFQVKKREQPFYYFLNLFKSMNTSTNSK